MLQGQVRMVPVTQNPQPFEFFPLDIDKLMGIRIALSPQIQGRHAVTVHAHGVQAGVFDRHAMGIPARYIGSVISFGILIFNNDIFQNFI